jgi:hypothetical protein
MEAGISFSDVWFRFTQYAGSMNQQTWLVICAVGCVVGFICLRGFGSRSSY